MDFRTMISKCGTRRFSVFVAVVGLVTFMLVGLILSTSSDEQPIGVTYIAASAGQRPIITLTNRTDARVLVRYTFQYKIISEWMGWAGSESTPWMEGKLATLEPHSSRVIQSFAIDPEDSWRLRISVQKTLPGGFSSIGPRLSAYYWLWHQRRKNGTTTSQLPGPFSPYLMSPPKVYFVPLVTTNNAFK